MNALSHHGVRPECRPAFAAAILAAWQGWAARDKRKTDPAAYALSSAVLAELRAEMDGGRE